MKDVGYNVKISAEEAEGALRELAIRKLAKAGRALDPSDERRFHAEAKVFVEAKGTSLGDASVTWTE